LSNSFTRPSEVSLRPARPK